MLDIDGVRFEDRVFPFDEHHGRFDAGDLPPGRCAVRLVTWRWDAGARRMTVHSPPLAGVQLEAGRQHD